MLSSKIILWSFSDGTLQCNIVRQNKHLRTNNMVIHPRQVHDKTGNGCFVCFVPKVVQRKVITMLVMYNTNNMILTNIVIVVILLNHPGCFAIGKLNNVPLFNLNYYWFYGAYSYCIQKIKYYLSY